MESDLPEIIISDKDIDIEPIGDIKYLVILSTEVELLDFSKIEESGPTTLKKSVDGEKTIIKWYGKEPDFIEILSYKEGPLPYDEILDIVSGEEWNPEIDKA